MAQNSSSKRHRKSTHWLDSPTLLALLVGALATLAAHAQTNSFVTFESGPVRPVALSPNGQLLFAVNTPDNRLEIFNVTDTGLSLAHSVPVGMEPVAVASRGNDEVWVVNHVSDSVSIVDLGGGETLPHVARTLPVGDEPRDIVFAGPSRNRAFITTAHRGQNSPVAYLPLESQGRADVWVFDADRTEDPLTIVTLFGDTPRALAASPDGTQVYAAIFQSGNKTTALSTATVSGDLPPPFDNADGVAAPWTGLIVRFDGTNWVDPAGRVWTDQTQVSLPDWDVFMIDAMAPTPREVARIPGVGTTLFNMAVNPVTSRIYVSNTDARNDIRFEGPGEYAGSTVRGHFVESRITVIDGQQVLPRHLNKHIDYESFPGTPAENATSLATPLDMQISGDGTTLYVAAYGSGAVGVFDVAELENGDFEPDASKHIRLTGGGPSGLALDEARGRLYVSTRFDNGVSVVDLTTMREIGHFAMHNPEPPAVLNGRRFLYDARYTSSRGDSSCAGCHTFGDTDHLSWDLGNPDGEVVENPNPFEPNNPIKPDFHPMKGPMTTQSLRGMREHAPLHWRGDRTGAAQPGGDAFDADAAFKAFNDAFEGLIGREETLTDAEMQAFTDFALEITYPPNPIRALDNTLTPAQAIGRQIFFDRPDPTTGVICNDCHTTDRSLGVFGTGGESVGRPRQPEAIQSIKVPHLRNLYTKVGFFETTTSDPQIRGYGYMHDGATESILRFLASFTVFSDGQAGLQERLGMTDFLLAFDSNMAPIVGQQVTLSFASGPAELQRAELLRQRALLSECDLIGKVAIEDRQRGFLLQPAGVFRSDRNDEPPLTLAQLNLLAHVPGQSMTFTCAPPFSGVRMGIDRDEDGFFDSDEVDAGSNPADPGSVPSDTDGDGVANVADNCSSLANANQRDTNGDGLGNLCDADIDNNCIVNFTDLALLKAAFFSAEPDADFDGDGTVTFGDLATMKEGFFKPPGPSGVPNACAG